MAGADITVALGSPVNYRIESASPNCYYKVTMTNLADARVADVRDVVTDANGVAVASFQHLAVGDYELHARAINCGGCQLPCKRVSVIQDCSINVCGSCNTGCGTSATCTANWTVSPTAYQTGQTTPTTYTLSGVPNCRVKLLFFDGDAPYINPYTNAQLFTYIVNGQPMTADLLWPADSAGAQYNWRPAPMAEQDACLQNCTIYPPRVNLTIAAGTTCEVGFTINPTTPVVNQANAGFIQATGLPPGCSLKIQAFSADGVTPVLSLGQPIYLVIPQGTNVPFTTVGGTVGDVAVWKPVAIVNQAGCLAGCTITTPSVTVTVIASGNSSCALGVTSQACVSNELQTVFNGGIQGQQYTIEISQDSGVTWGAAGLSAITWQASSTYTVTLNSSTSGITTAGFRVRLKSVANSICVSPTQSSNPCASSSASYWCLNGNCTQAVSQPVGSTGPYVSLGACQSACTAPSGAAQINLADQFSPTAPPCTTISGALNWTVGVYQSFSFSVVNALSTSVTVTGIPAGMTRTNYSGAIQIAGVPTTAGAVSISATSGACVCVVAGTISAGCVINYALSLGIVSNGEYSIITVTDAPANCEIIFGLYDTSDNPITVAGTHVTFGVNVNSIGTGSLSLGPCADPGTGRIKPLAANLQPCLGAASCSFTPAYLTLVCTA